MNTIPAKQMNIDITIIKFNKQNSVKYVLSLMNVKQKIEAISPLKKMPGRRFLNTIGSQIGVKLSKYRDSLRGNDLDDFYINIHHNNL